MEDSKLTMDEVVNGSLQLTCTSDEPIAGSYHYTPMTPARRSSDLRETPSSDRIVSRTDARQRRASLSGAPRSNRVLAIPSSPNTPRSKKQMVKQKLDECLLTSVELSTTPPRNVPPTKLLKSIRPKRSSLSVLQTSSANQARQEHSKPNQHHSRTKTTGDITMNERNLHSDKDFRNSHDGFLNSSDGENVVLTSALSKPVETKGSWSTWMRGDPHAARLKNAKSLPSSEALESQVTPRLEKPTSFSPRMKGRVSYHRRNRASAATGSAIRDSVPSLRNMRATKSALLTPRNSTAALHAAFSSPTFSSGLDLETSFTFQGRDKESSAPLPVEPLKAIQKHKLLRSANTDETNLSQTSKESKPPHMHKQGTAKLNLNLFFEKRPQPQRIAKRNDSWSVQQTNLSFMEPFYSPQNSSLSGLGIVGDRSGDQIEKQTESLENRLKTLADTPLSTRHASPTLITASTPRSLSEDLVPRIVVTPPAIIARAGAGRKSELSRSKGRTIEEYDSNDAAPSSGDQINKAKREDCSTARQAERTPAKLNNDIANGTFASEDTMSWTLILPSEHDLPSFELQELRAAEDARGLNRFKLAIDSFLSELFIQRGQEDVRSMAVRLLDLLGSTMDPDGNCDFRIASRPVQIPSLCAICVIRKPHASLELRPLWVRWKLQTSIDLVFEHIITGMIALIVDDRAPFGTPRNVAFLAHAVTEECVPPRLIQLDKIRSAEFRNQQDTALGNWVHLCASAVGLGGPNRSRAVPTPTDMAQNLMLSSEERAQWSRCLDNIEPGPRFGILLRKHVNMILERGEASRARNNSLSVPPPRRGSRKRWQAAQIEMLKQRAQHEENFAKLTKGEISESQYRSDERRRAALGQPHDAFAAMNLVRFVGELYKVSIVDIHAVRAWIHRLLFDTAYTGVPSMYELEAGCALLITIGAHLDSLSDSDEMVKPDESSALEPNCAPSMKSRNISSTAPFSVQSNHSPGLSNRACANSVMSEASLAQATISASISRLSEIQTIEEVDEEGRSWCREIIALHGRGWRPLPSTRHMNAISSAGKAARRNRRGGSGYHAHSAPSSDEDTPVPASWSDDEVLRFTSSPPPRG